MDNQEVLDNLELARSEIEEWRDIKDYEGYFQISNLGRVRSLDRILTSGQKRYGMIRKPVETKKGYYSVLLNKGGKRKGFPIHRLVAMAFIPNPQNLPMVNHKDENRKNNCVENLEWCDASYNNNYGLRNKRVAKKLAKPVIATRINDKKREWYRSMSEAGRMLGTSEGNIWQAIKTNGICRGRKIKILEDEKMTVDEIIEYLEKAKAIYEKKDIGIAAALDVAIKHVKDWEQLKECIKGAKWSANHLADMNYKAGYMCALSFVQGLMAEMENKDDSN